MKTIIIQNETDMDDYLRQLSTEIKNLICQKGQYFDGRGTLISVI